jgi:hypothetical protein
VEDMIVAASTSTVIWFMPRSVQLATTVAPSMLLLLLLVLSSSPLSEFLDLMLSGLKASAAEAAEGLTQAFTLVRAQDVLCSTCIEESTNCVNTASFLKGILPISSCSDQTVSPHP